MNLTKSIRQIMFACGTAAFAAGSLAAVGLQNPPPGPGQIPDYFGVTGNYANSPEPVLATVAITGTGTGAIAAATTYDYNSVNPAAYTGGITDVQILNGGTGYLNGNTGYDNATTSVTVNGGLGVTPVTGLTAEVYKGVIVGIKEFNPFVRDLTSTGTGLNTATPNPSYIGNLATPVTFLGTGFTVPLTGTGLKKFVNHLPGIPGVSSYTTGPDYTNGFNDLGQGLPVAVPDTTKFPGSDYYEIAESAYTQQLHSGLPATHLRGYKQLNAPAGSASASNQYLGPIIIAHKNRPVRVKLVNQLPLKGSAGLGDQLPFPVDHTYMGAAGVTDTDNRTALHMHGGNTPWISDGTPRQWIKPAGEVGANKGVSATNVPDMYFVAGAVVPACSTTVTASCSLPAGQLQAKLPAGATTNPGDGALTFFFTNEQSARLMFYHDHAEGLTRLNVYDGLAAGFLLQDPTEQAMVSGGTPAAAALAMGYSPADQATYDNVTVYPAVLPPLVDTIPLVIQEKTFVPDNTNPVLNFYGPFASQLNSSDPTWRWGSGVVATGVNGTGDLWVPHVYMPNQNPGDISGANNFGRWDYGPWFWPPFTGITHGAVTNPYYDATCVSSAANYCEGQYIPGVPNGNTLTAAQLTALNYDPTFLTLGEATGTPEAFNDTPLVNGTVYPVLKVDPKQYRLRILSVGNDRMLNLSLVVAASNLTPNTARQTAAPAANTTVMCDGTTTVDRSLCTEARMVPFNATQDAVSSFPAWWYTMQKGGVTFDGRPSGVFDPATRGPAMVQIGTDGGFISTPVVIKNQPVNFEYNLKNIVVTNVKEHALLLGPAERADVVVDFSNFAGSTLLMYNDAPAPMPAFDLRLDYFTGDYDNTDTGGAFSTLPGYGPNTRTLMQIQVSGSGGSHPVDDTGTINLANLTTAVQTAFRTSQEPIIVPQAAYNAVYNANKSSPDVADSTLASNANHNLALIQDYSLNFTPYATPATGGAVTAPVLMDMQPKTIIEDWTMDYGRMNALLGVEIPKTSATTNTALPLGDTDAPTELVKISPNDSSAVGAAPLTDGTTLWRVTHNGVDSHAIHFHLFHVQIVNRVGWDGMIRPTEPNELGWKDTVRMNPLEDVVVALRPKVMTTLPFKVPNSRHLLDPAQAAGGTNGFYNLDPSTGNASTVTNVNVNYGWEYIWHCHILGHEENDMMRTIVVAKTPEAPTAVTAVSGAGNSVTVNWIDNSVISNWVTIQRALDSAFTTGLTTLNVQVPECAVQTGCARSYVDTTAPGASVYYRLTANNTAGAGDVNLALPATLLPAVGNGPVTPLTPGLAGYDNVTSESAFSSGANGVGSLILPLSPSAVAFGNVQVTSALVPSSSVKVVTVTNTSAAAKTFTIPTFCTQATGVLATCTTTGAPANYSQTNNCGSSVAAGASCAITVTLRPTTTGAKTAYMRVANFGTLGTSPAVYGAVALTATGTNPAATATTPLAFANVQAGTTTAPMLVTLTNTGNGPLSYTSATLAGTNPAKYSLSSNTCVSPLAAGATCSIGVKFAPGAIAGAPVAYPATLAIVDGAGTQTVALTGTGMANPVAVAVSATSGTNATAVAATTQNLNAAAIGVNVLTSSAPVGIAGRTVTNVSAVTHSTGLNGGVLPSNPATATVSITAAGAVSMVLTSPVTTVTAPPLAGNTARQASKQGTYRFTYTVTYNGVVSSPATVTIIVN